ncbi:MAG: hypothetical protein ACR2KT_13910 [Methylocella sp.]|nr:MAG: hypothetical protein DLM68_01065 [Hyphomicrobiales bacterium]
MQDTDVLNRHWRDDGLSRPLHRAMAFTQAGLVLGRGTLLAEFEKQRLAPRGLALDGNEARVVSLLTAAHGEPVAEAVIEKIRRAAEFWCADEKTLAQIHFAFIGLPTIDEMGAYRLFLAETTLEKGLDPSDLMKALGFPRAVRALEKSNPDQPRVAAGSGRESGQWTSGDGSWQRYAQASEPPPPIRRLHPDETYEMDQKAKGALDYWRQQSTKEIIQRLKPRTDNQEALTVRPDGTVVQGNTRIKVLEERGVDVNSLPRAPYDDNIEMFLPQIRTPGGGGGPTKDKKYPIQE